MMFYGKVNYVGIVRKETLNADLHEISPRLPWIKLTFFFNDIQGCFMGKCRFFDPGS
jgi:hypothetical protein